MLELQKLSDMDPTKAAGIPKLISEDATHFAGIRCKSSDCVFIEGFLKPSTIYTFALYFSYFHSSGAINSICVDCLSTENWVLINQNQNI